MTTDRVEIGPQIEFLKQTRELAHTMLRAAADGQNPAHQAFCRRAACDFLSSVMRLLPHVKATEPGRGEVLAAAERLQVRLQRRACIDASPVKA